MPLQTQQIDRVRETSIRALPFLPFEILSAIFLAFRDAVLREWWHAMAKLLVVSQVCGRWRNISHSTGALWTHLILNFHTKEHYLRLRSLINVWVKRSHPHPLTFDVRSCYPLAENPVIDLVLMHASRIRDLTLDLPAAHFYPFLLARAGSFPVLESIDLSVICKCDTVYDTTLGLSRFEYFQDGGHFHGEPDIHGGVLWWDVPGRITVFTNAPRLHDISIGTLGFVSLQPDTLRLPWSTLTTVNLMNVGLSVLGTMSVLRMCANVHDLSLSTDASMGRYVPATPRVRLPLTTLPWQGLGVDGASVLAPLVVPNLTKAELRGATEKVLLRLQQNTHFPLQNLRLVFCSLHLPRFGTFLRATPSITSLGLYQAHPSRMLSSCSSHSTPTTPSSRTWNTSRCATYWASTILPIRRY
ncbi:hypothetical protein C8F04DRAFT_1133509 [Mycena alexandri]|uniref:F-box domain-containing protein n=1 Tax=Mycena alexandri TaxID=1745969 RepID=A0AAD6SCH3_9AGAR|nr:hypothetical protein C8F04DRAFT_1133509 [Mycena alexandri]